MYLSGMRHGYRIHAHLFTTILISFLAGCQQTLIDDRALIQQQIESMADAVEQHQAAPFLQGVQRDFRGQEGLYKANLAAMLRWYFQQYDVISVKLSKLEIQLEGQQASVVLTVQLNTQRGWPLAGRQLHIQSRWLKHDDAWQVARARWQVSH